LWVRGRGAPGAAVKAADDVAWDLDIYGTADFSWTYESGLPAALDALERQPPLNCRVWTEVLVPFVAALFVRSPDFIREFERRFSPQIAARFSAVTAHDRGSGPRLIEFQQLLAPVMAMRWAVLHNLTATPLITSDAAFAPTVTPLGLGYVIPIGPRSALLLAQAQSRAVLRWQGGRWVAPIEHLLTRDDLQPQGWNRAIAAQARREVVGSTQSSVDAVEVEVGIGPALGSAFLGGLAQVDLGCHLYDYFRVISALGVPLVDAARAADEIDWRRATRRWAAPIAVEVLFPERTSGGVRIEDGAIVVDLSLGLDVRRHRRAAGDFREGARIQVPVDKIATFDGGHTGMVQRPVSLAALEEHIMLGMGPPLPESPYVPAPQPKGSGDSSSVPLARPGDRF